MCGNPPICGNIDLTLPEVQPMYYSTPNVKDNFPDVSYEYPQSESSVRLLLFLRCLSPKCIPCVVYVFVIGHILIFFLSLSFQRR